MFLKKVRKFHGPESGMSRLFWLSGAWNEAFQLTLDTRGFYKTSKFVFSCHQENYHFFWKRSVETAVTRNLCIFAHSGALWINRCKRISFRHCFFYFFLCAELKTTFWSPRTGARTWLTSRQPMQTISRRWWAPRTSNTKSKRALLGGQCYSITRTWLKKSSRTHERIFFAVKLKIVCFYSNWQSSGEYTGWLQDEERGDWLLGDRVAKYTLIISVWLLQKLTYSHKWVHNTSIRVVANVFTRTWLKNPSNQTD